MDGLRRRWALTAIGFTLGASCGPQSGGSSDTEATGTSTGCVVGTEACACTPGGGCDPGLECLGDICVRLPDDSVDGSTSATPSTTSGNTSTTGDTTSTTGPTDTTTTTEDGTSTGGPLCGNGSIDPGEDCDDGNGNNGDGCNNDCTPSAQLLWDLNVPTVYNLDQDAARGIAVDTAGNVIVAGIVNTPTSDDIWVGKYTDDGMPVWDDSYDGTAGGNDAAWSVAADSSDNAFVVGFTVSGGSAGVDRWIRKYSAAGAVQWTVIDDLHTSEGMLGVDVAANDDVIVGGYFGGGGGQAWMRRYTNDGMTVWTEIFTVDGVGLLQGLALDPAGNIAVTGGLTPWATKYDDTPSQLWGGLRLGANESFDVAVDSTGDVYTVGSVGLAMWIKKYDGATGAELWTETTYMGLSGDAAVGFGVTVDLSDNVVVVGAETLPGQGFNAFVRKYEPAGTVLWTQTFNGPIDGDDRAYEVATNAAEEIFVAGYTTVAGEGANIWIAKYSP